jgi:Protein of unknown function (DUF3551)
MTQASIVILAGSVAFCWVFSVLLILWFFRPRTRPNPRSKEMIMRKISVISTILVTLFLSSTGAHSATWCAHYGTGNGTNCGFHSYEQCQAAISGNGGYCSQSP